MKKFELIHASELLKEKPAMTLYEVLDAVITYCPEYMHGIPKRRYIRLLERTIESQKKQNGFA